MSVGMIEADLSGGVLDPLSFVATPGHSPGDKWFVDETYVKINGVWRRFIFTSGSGWEIGNINWFTFKQ